MKKWVSILVIMGTLFLSACTSKLGSTNANGSAQAVEDRDTSNDIEYAAGEISIDSIEMMDNGYIVVSQRMAARTAEQCAHCKQLEKKFHPVYNHDIIDTPQWEKQIDSTIDYNALDSWKNSLCIALQDELFSYSDIANIASGFEKHLQQAGIADKCLNLVGVLRTIQNDCQNENVVPEDREEFLRYQANALVRNNLFISTIINDNNLEVTSEISAFNKALIEIIRHITVSCTAKQLLSDVTNAQEKAKTVASVYKFPVANLFIVNEILNDLQKYLTKETSSPGENIADAQPANGSKESSAKGDDIVTSANTITASPAHDEKKASNYANASPAVTDNASKSQVGVEQMTPSGLKYIITKAGNGNTCKPGDIVRIHYIGQLTDGTTFDSSYDRSEPIEFTLGKGVVIDGWESGISGMKINEHRHLVIPPALGYGKEGNGPIPPNATLIFDVELIAIK